MNKRLIPMLAGLAVVAAGAPASAVELCHVANAGFLVKGEEASVLIDGLMEQDQYRGRFALPSTDHLNAMIEKTGDYENLALVVSTHRHGDHFDPLATLKHLRATSNVRYAYPADAVASLEANGLKEQERSRIIIIPDASRTDFTLGSIAVQTYDVDHGPNQPQNVGYRITVDGVSFFHTGDINASRQQLASAGLNALQVDVLIMPFWFGHQDPEQLATVRQSWNAKMVIPTHFNPMPQPWMAQYGGMAGVQKSVKSAFGRAEIITEEGKCITVE